MHFLHDTMFVFEKQLCFTQRQRRSMRIGLLGCGVVGSGVCKILDESHSKYQIKRILVKIKEECVDKRMTIDVRRILDDSNIETVIECMGGIEPAFSYVKEALSLKKEKEEIEAQSDVLKQELQGAQQKMNGILSVIQGNNND